MAVQGPFKVEFGGLFRRGLVGGGRFAGPVIGFDA
jgi:hypothetical protein